MAAYGRERALAIHRLTAAEIARMHRETPEAVRLTGSLRIAASPKEEADCRAQLVAMEADGLPAEAYDGPEGRGILFPTDAAFNPLLRCRILAHRAVEAGATLFEHSPALEIPGSEVRTAAGAVRCERVIVCVDGSLDRLLPALAGRVRTARLQMVATAPLPEVRFPRPVYMRWGYEWWQQLADGRVALGGFRDRAGEGEWTCETTPSEAVQAMIERFLREDLKIDAPITHRWAACVGFTESGLPVCDEVEPGVWAVGGYSGTGNAIGAILGRAAAQLAARGESDLAAPFRDG
jgi:gamma-glutamylputrescine oxidase